MSRYRKIGVMLQTEENGYKVVRAIEFAYIHDRTSLSGFHVVGIMPVQNKNVWNWGQLVKEYHETT